MYWKSGKVFHSLKVKLTVLYTVLIFLIAFLVTLGSYFIITHLLHKAATEFVTQEMRTIKYLLGKENNAAALRQEIHDVPGAATHAKYYYYYIRVYHHNTQLLIETQGMAHILPFQKTLPAHKFQFNQNKQEYLFTQEIYSANHQLYTIQILLNISYPYKLIHQAKNILLIILLFSALLSFYFGFLIMKKNLRHLQQISQAMKNISSSSLDQRVVFPAMPEELQSLSLAFNHMLEGLENAFIRLKQFSGDLAHEMRTPINNLMGETELAIMHQYSDKECHAVLESNLEELQRLSQMIENLLFLAQTENPQQNFTKSMVQVHIEIKKLIDYYEDFALEKDISLSMRGQGELMVNSDMFKRMISNLLSNAIKYTLPGGRIYITIQDKKDSLQIDIQDTGVGIAKEYLPKIFDRFYRVDESRTKTSGGIGLGLAIVKSIVELHKGSITIDSEFNKGTVISLKFYK